MFTFEGKVEAQEQLLARYKWKKVEVPRAWHPRKVGEMLVGFYAGRTTRNGAYGQYDVILVLVPGEGAFMVSGVRLMQLVDASMTETGHPVQIIYQGEKDLGPEKDHTMKLFDFFVAEGEPVDASVMPSVGPI